MDQDDRDKIICNQVELKRLINFDELKLHLLNFKIFTEEMISDYELLPGEERNAELINDLPTRGPKAFHDFAEILLQTKQLDAAKLLGFETNNNRNSLSHQGGGVRIDSTTGGAPALQTVKRSIKHFHGETIYKMSSFHRGLCLLINNYDFENNLHDYRKGSKRDEGLLTEVFQQLGFLVDRHINLSSNAMDRRLTEFASRPAHKTYDAAVIIILTHGKPNVLFGSDGNTLSCNSILTKFNNNNCPYLQGKPKLFFTQACRGSLESHGASRLRTDSKRSFAPAAATPPPLLKPIESERMPSITDMLVSYSCVEEYAAYRDEEHGSWYIIALVEALINHAHEWEINQILSEMERIIQKNVGPHGERTSTEWRSIGFTKSLYFNTLL